MDAVPRMEDLSLPQFRLVQRMGARGKRFVVQDLDGRVIGQYVLQKNARKAAFVRNNDGQEEEVFVLKPKRVKLFAAAFAVESAPGAARIGEVRRREYKALRKEEWFLLGPDGEPVGMVAMDPSRLGKLQQAQPFRMLFPISYSVHWGQKVAGSIQRRSDLLLNDHMQIDLSMNPGPEVDRRLVLSVAYCIRDGERLSALDLDD